MQRIIHGEHATITNSNTREPGNVSGRKDSMYFIEELVPCVIKVPYSYERRAQGTIHSEKWVQRYACKERAPLDELMAKLDHKTYRLTTNIVD